MMANPLEGFSEDLSPAECRSVFVSAADGLRLHVREYGHQAASPALSVVCYQDSHEQPQISMRLRRRLPTTNRSGV
jgi:hypothetical protein